MCCKINHNYTLESVNLVRSTTIATQQKVWQIALVIVPYGCSTIHMMFDWLLAEGAIDENESTTRPGVIVSLVHASAWKIGFSLSAFAVNIILADLVFVSTASPLL